MNNKGFTLIELLAVIVILISISFIAVSQITSSLTRREERECEEQIEIAKNAAKIYFSLNEDSDNQVKISDLKEGGFFNESDKINKLQENDTIELTDDNFIFEGNGDCKQKDS